MLTVADFQSIFGKMKSFFSPNFVFFLARIDMSSVPNKDCRGYFILPQAPEQCGYYTYGTPGDGAGQYVNPGLLSLILMVEHRWQNMDARKFGIGNISLADGVDFPKHSGHEGGLDVDIRPLRLDGKKLPVTRFDAQYDKNGTSKLIGLFRQYGNVNVVYFNDRSIVGVEYRDAHDNHFHVTINI